MSMVSLSSRNDLEYFGKANPEGIAPKPVIVRFISMPLVSMGEREPVRVRETLRLHAVSIDYKPM